MVAPFPQDHAESAGKAALQRVEQYKESSRLPDRHEHMEAFGWDDINLGRVLDQGSFSCVYEATLRRDTVQPPTRYAVKCLRQNVTEREDTFVTGAVDLALEAKILAKITHDNIIQLHGCTSGCISESFLEGVGFFLVLDLLVDTLDKRLSRWRRESKVAAPWGRKAVHHHKREVHDRIENVALGVAQGMAYLHSKQIMYRDLKPHNIGFDEHGVVRIFDFGLAREANTKGDLRHATGNAGTPRYMAPEVARNESYGFPSDVYSYSILLWEVLTLGKPFDTIKTLPQFNEEVVRRNVRPTLKRVTSQELKTLLETSWDADPALRPTFSSVITTLEQEVVQSDDPGGPAILRKLKSMTSFNEKTSSLSTQSSSATSGGYNTSGTLSSDSSRFRLFSRKSPRPTVAAVAVDRSYSRRTWVQRNLLRQPSLSLDRSLRSIHIRQYDLGRPRSGSFNESQASGEDGRSAHGSVRRRSSGASESNLTAMAEALAAEAKSSRQALRELKRSSKRKN